MSATPGLLLQEGSWPRERATSVWLASVLSSANISHDVSHQSNRSPGSSLSEPSAPQPAVAITASARIGVQAVELTLKRTRTVSRLKGKGDMLLAKWALEPSGKICSRKFSVLSSSKNLIL